MCRFWNWTERDTTVPNNWYLLYTNQHYFNQHYTHRKMQRYLVMVSWLRLMANPEPLIQEADPPISKFDVELEMADNMVQKKTEQKL